MTTKTTKHPTDKRIAERAQRVREGERRPADDPAGQKQLREKHNALVRAQRGGVNAPQSK